MNELVPIFKGISDPIRLSMVGLLLNHDELCVCDLMAALQLPQSTTSRHLSYLRRCGWLTSRKEGLWHYYRLSGSLRARYSELLGILESRLKNSDAMLDRSSRLDEFMKSKKIC